MKHNLVRKASATILLIVESPSKCATIEKYLGATYQCVATCGHFREIANGLDGINHRFEPTFTWMEDKKAHMSSVKTLAKTFDSVLLATDDDREGEAIAWHVCQVIGLSVDTTPRIVFHEITADALLQAVQHPRTLDMAVVRAQHARQVLDLMVGYTISPFLWRAFYRGKGEALSAGRCQTPTLRLVYDNAQLQRTTTLDIQYRTIGTFLHTPFELDHEFKSPDHVREFLSLHTGAHPFEHVLTMLPVRDRVENPPQPLTTSSLLQLASNVLHSPPKRTMQLCQTLYQQGRITYMRTDSQTYAAPFLHTAAAYIRQRFGSEAFVRQEWESTTASGTEAAATATAHEAIRVTDLSVSTVDDAATAAMYKLIWRTTLESCMTPATFRVYPLRISAPQGWEYKHSIDIPVFLGWKRVVHEVLDTSAAEALYMQAKLLQTQRVPFQHIRSTAVARHTHAHYTEASLVKALEDKGIGRPSTYATLVETIQERGYVTCTDIAGTTVDVPEFTLLAAANAAVEESLVQQTFGQEKKKLVIQPVGTACVEFLMHYFGPLFDYEYTLQMEQQLDLIASSVVPDGFAMCKTCADDMERLSQPVVQLGKVEYDLADSSEHKLVFQKYGFVIRRTDPVDKSVCFLPVVKDVDVERAKQGLYTVQELLVQSKDRCLGEHAGHPVTLKYGRFGPYLECNGEKKSVPKADADVLVLEDAIAILQHRAPPPSAAASSVLRTVNSDCSIRDGPHGVYVFYKTSEMKSPLFLSARSLANWKTATEDAIVKWIREQPTKSKKPRHCR